MEWWWFLAGGLENINLTCHDAMVYHHLSLNPWIQVSRMKRCQEFFFSLIWSSGSFLFSHGNKEVFSCLGIQLAVNFFLDRGHTDVKVFVPSWRKEQPRPDVPITGGWMKFLLYWLMRLLNVFGNAQRTTTE